MYFGGCLLVFFPLFHTIILFWSVWFPIYSKRTLDAYRHRIHAGVVLLCIAMPWVGVAAIAGSNSVDAVFYASLPLYGSCGLICALVGLIVWKLMGREMQKDKVSPFALQIWHNRIFLVHTSGVPLVEMPIQLLSRSKVDHCAHLCGITFCRHGCSKRFGH